MPTDSTLETDIGRRLGPGFSGPSAVGAGLFVVAAPVHLLVPQEISVAVAPVTLALVGGAYIGFGATARSLKTFWSELGVAVLFGGAALAGLLWNALALPAGLAAHAGLDLLHHGGRVGAPVPRWHIPFCVVFDLLAAGFLLALYLP